MTPGGSCAGPGEVALQERKRAGEVTRSNGAAGVGGHTQPPEDPGTPIALLAPHPANAPSTPPSAGRSSIGARRGAARSVERRAPLLDQRGAVLIRDAEQRDAVTGLVAAGVVAAPDFGRQRVAVVAGARGAPRAASAGARGRLPRRPRPARGRRSRACWPERIGARKPARCAICGSTWIWLGTLQACPPEQALDRQHRVRDPEIGRARGRVAARRARPRSPPKPPWPFTRTSR